MRGALWMESGPPEAERLVDSALIEGATAAEWLEQRIKASHGRGGRRGGLRVRTLLVALQLGAFEGDFFLSSVPELLDSLGPKERARLGLARTGRTVTYRQVCYLVTRIDEVLRGDFVRHNDRIVDGYRDFDLLFNALATTGAHPDSAAVKTIAIDGSDIPSWGADRRRHEVVWETDERGKPQIARDEEGHARYEMVRVVSDIDAGFRGSRTVEGKREHFGYCLTVAITTREEGGPEAPRAAVAARLRPTLVQDKEMGLAVIGEVAHRRGGPGAVLMDRGYTPSLGGEDFLLPIRAMGGEPIFSLTKNQLGPAGTMRGAVIIEGRPYSPSIPERLMHIDPPKGGIDGSYKPNPVLLREYQDQIAAREVYALVPHGTRRANGTQVFQCPGSAGKLDCPLQPARRGLREAAMPVLRVPTHPAPDSVCAKAFPSFTLEELPLMQRHVFGSREWHRSYSRRSSSVETFFANVKDASREGVWRGRIRVTGIIKTGLCLALAVASANRLALAFTPERASQPSRRRRPGRRTQHRKLTYRQVIEDAAASRMLLKT